MMNLSIIMPVLGVFFVLILAVVLIVVIGGIVGKRQTALSQRSFEELAKEIRQENAQIKAELLSVKEKVTSMDQMMKEI